MGLLRSLRVSEHRPVLVFKHETDLDSTTTCACPGLWAGYTRPASDSAVWRRGFKNSDCPLEVAPKEAARAAALQCAPLFLLDRSLGLRTFSCEARCAVLLLGRYILAAVCGPTCRSHFTVDPTRSNSRHFRLKASPARPVHRRSERSTRTDTSFGL